ncbi:siderophore ferric iron reductase [uncultured Devosia sp.]|uniref:siderophore ferric iron reductase n=1 Tax=uncultured Devosia sp. TaxID=211434 RepID=UPI00262E2F88|nr:siderophore ferric iron reductase [uncultured Devosia sp.]
MTSRNYLFAQTADDVALTRFIALAGSATGFLKGAPGGPLPGWHSPGQDNRAFLEELYERLAVSYPEAGQPFHAVRLWTNLMWQPAYLSVIAVHLHGALPAVTTLAQARQNLDVNGYRLAPGPQMEGSTEELIARAGRDLRAMGDSVLDEINAVTKLKQTPALRLLADRMLGLMVRLKHFRPEISMAEQYRYCDLWLSAMGLEGQGGLETLDLPNGQQVAIMARKGCCLDYLAFPERYCASCPKLSDDERRNRERTNIMAELEVRAQSNVSSA